MERREEIRERRKEGKRSLMKDEGKGKHEKEGRKAT